MFSKWLNLMVTNDRLHSWPRPIFPHSSSHTSSWWKLRRILLQKFSLNWRKKHLVCFLPPEEVFAKYKTASIVEYLAFNPMTPKLGAKISINRGDLIYQRIRIGLRLKNWLPLCWKNERPLPQHGALPCNHLTSLSLLIYRPAKSPEKQWA